MQLYNVYQETFNQSFENFCNSETCKLCKIYINFDANNDFSLRVVHGANYVFMTSETFLKQGQKLYIRIKVKVVFRSEGLKVKRNHITS